MFELADFAAGCGVPDAADFLRRMQEFHRLLCAENAIHNLTRIVSPEEFAIKHVADSLALVRSFPDLAAAAPEVADIGCGAGFPSIVLAAAFPDWRITAIDSTGKKAGFVARAAAELGLLRLTAVQGRAVELNRRREFQYRFDLVTARAVAAAGRLWRECSRFPRRPGGRFIFYKTPGQAAEELAGLAAQTPGWHWSATPEFELPEGAGRRLFVVGRAD